MAGVSKKTHVLYSWGDSCVRGGQAPALRQGRLRFTVGRGPVPRRASVGESLCLRAFFARVERSRGPVPRATVCKAVSFHRRARACPSPCLGQRKSWFACVFRAGRVIAGDRPPRYGPGRVSPLRRARACPSPCLGRERLLSACVFRAGRTISGDRPPRYGIRAAFSPIRFPFSLALNHNF